MTTDAVAGQAFVTVPDRLENPQVSALDGDDVAPGRQALPGAGPMPAEQLDDDPQEQLQQGIAGEFGKSDMKS